MHTIVFVRRGQRRISVSGISPRRASTAGGVGGGRGESTREGGTADDERKAASGGRSSAKVAGSLPSIGVSFAAFPSQKRARAGAGATRSRPSPPSRPAKARASKPATVTVQRKRVPTDDGDKPGRAPRAAATAPMANINRRRVAAQRRLSGGEGGREGEERGERDSPEKSVRSPEGLRQAAMRMALEGIGRNQGSSGGRRYCQTSAKRAEVSGC
jgi:hypothetical protein